MNITDLFIKRPVMTALVMIGIVLFGIAGYRALPVSDLPNVDFPTIQVMASLPGATPETMATAVATPLERQFATVAGIDTMISSSGVGSTSITIQFTLDRSIDGAAADVQSAIAAVVRLLPPGMPSPPTLRKVNPGDMPVLLLGISGSAMEHSRCVGRGAKHGTREACAGEILGCIINPHGSDSDVRNYCCHSEFRV